MFSWFLSYLKLLVITFIVSAVIHLDYMVDAGMCLTTCFTLAGEDKITSQITKLYQTPSSDPHTT